MTEEAKMWQYRVGWSGSSNASFSGRGEWITYDGDPADSAEELEERLSEGGELSTGLETAIDYSGFEWYLEVREWEPDE